MEWNGDILQAMEEDPDISYVVPKEGSIVWEVETHNLRAKRLYQDIGFFTHDRILMSYWVD